MPGDPTGEHLEHVAPSRLHKQSEVEDYSIALQVRMWPKPETVSSSQEPKAGLYQLY